jgi:hypothetical protein
MEKFKTAAMAMTLTLLGACGTQAPTRPSTPASDIRVMEATETQVASCKFLEEVSSVSGKGFLSGAARAGAQREVLNKAAAAGATHLVWMASSEVLESTTTRGKAYRCE